MEAVDITAVEAPKERMSWEEIGDAEGITPERARKIFYEGMEKLRASMTRSQLRQGLLLLQGSLQADRHRCDGHTVSVPRRKAA